MSRRIPILAKLLGAYLVPTVATFAGFGLLAHYIAAHALENELGNRLTAIAAATATQIADENVALLQPGDEGTRTYRNLRHRLDELRAATGAARVYVFAPDGTSRCDSSDGTPIGARYYRLDADRAELRRTFAGFPSASVLFRGLDGRLYKSAFAAVKDDRGQARFAVGVDGAAAMYEELAGFRRTLLAVGLGGTAVVVLLSVLVARLLTRPVRRLERAAERVGAGDLDTPVEASSRDEIGRVAETLEQMRLGLRARDERMQMMLAGIAHEVRNPLGGLALYAGLLRDELPAEDPRREHVVRVEREIDRLKSIVADFLEYARRPKPQAEPLDAGALLSEVRDLADAEARQRRVTVTLEATAARVTGDGGQLRRALLNLARNAVEACPADGTGQVRLGCARRGVHVVFTVADSGPGIAPATRERMYTPFFTTKQSGTGLGLAFVRDIARDHGAELAVESDPGRGTLFTLILPAVEPA